VATWNGNSWQGEWLGAWLGGGADPGTTGLIAQGTGTATMSPVVSLRALVPTSAGGVVRQMWEVDSFSDWPTKPKRKDDEECLLLMMI
jgi:hypothetical protein